MNACINPIVYAATIPAFKRLINSVVRCKPLGNEGRGIGLQLSSMRVTKRESSTATKRRSQYNEC